jgi:hypothetical protein
MRWPTIIALSGLLAVGLVSFVLVRNEQGYGAGFLVTQQNAQRRLTPADVNRAIRLVRDPTTQAAAQRASCRSLGSGALRNPWRCLISYPAGKKIRWTVHISLSGLYTGYDQVLIERGRITPSAGSVSGCCVAVP